MELRERIEEGKRLTAAGDHGAARACFEAVLADDPGNTEALFELGKLRYIDGDHVRALPLLAKAAGDNAHARRLMAKIARETGGRNAGKNGVPRAAGEDFCPDRRAQVRRLLELRQPAGALKEIETLRAAGRDDAEIRFAAAEALRDLGRLPDALEELLAALRFSGDYRRVYGEMKKIDPPTGEDGGEKRPGGTRRAAAPSSLMIVPTRRCNVACRMCGIAGETATLPYAAFEKIAPLLPFVNDIRWQGGEVFLADYFRDAYRRIGEHYPSIRHGIFTNGLLLDDEWLRLLSRGTLELTFSVDSTDPSVYEGVRKGGSFRQLVRNLERAGGVLGTMGDKTLSLNAIVMKSTMAGLAEFPRFCRRYNIRRLSFGYMYPARLPGENVFAGNDPSAVTALARIVSDVAAACAESGIAFDCNFSRLLGPAAGIPGNGGGRKGTACSRPWDSLFLDADGSVRPWCACDIPAGSVFISTIDEIWNEGIMAMYRKRVREGNLRGWCRKECGDGVAA